MREQSAAQAALAAFESSVEFYAEGLRRCETAEESRWRRRLDAARGVVDALLAYEATCAKVRAERQAMAEARAKAEARLAWLDELAERDAAKAQAVDRGD